MSITYGFFNSLDGDRLYNADQMSTYFRGLVAENGVYEQTGGAFRVVATTGLTLNVLSGRALVRSKWVNSDATESVNITAAHVTLNRYTAVVLELDVSSRVITLKTVDGTPATNPVKPAILNNADYRQLCLAYVYVAAGATTITQANITDTRPDNTVCGWITGLINQVDTSVLFAQWQNAYEQYFADMVSWKTAQETAFETWSGNQETAFEQWEVAQKNAFETWLHDLTSELNVDTYIAQYNKQVTLTASSSRDIPLNMTGYIYENADVFFVSFNGLVAEQGTDYTVTGATPKITVTSATFSGTVDIKILKSKIGVAP